MLLLYCASILDGGRPSLIIHFISPVWPRAERQHQAPCSAEWTSNNKSFCRRRSERGQLSLWHLGVILALWDCFFRGSHVSWKGFHSLLSLLSSVVPTVKLFHCGNAAASSPLPLLRGRPGHYKGVGRSCSLPSEVAVPTSSPTFHLLPLSPSRGDGVGAGVDLTGVWCWGRHPSQTCTHKPARNEHSFILTLCHQHEINNRFFF